MQNGKREKQSMLIANRDLQILTKLNSRLESDMDHIKRVHHYKMYKRKDTHLSRYINSDLHLDFYCFQIIIDFFNTVNN